MHESNRELGADPAEHFSFENHGRSYYNRAIVRLYATADHCEKNRYCAKGGERGMPRVLCPPKEEDYRLVPLLFFGGGAKDRLCSYHILSTLPTHSSHQMRYFSQAATTSVSLCVLESQQTVTLTKSNDSFRLLRFRLIMMPKEGKLKSTTVRFTIEDLQIIESLQRRLGLGMVQMIRLAIRRLAQLENVLPSHSKPDAR